MCESCGCSHDGSLRIARVHAGEKKPAPAPHSHDPVHDHPHPHVHVRPGHGHQGHSTTVPLEENLLSKNNLLAQRNRGWFEGRGILALNLVSSPGAGKTTLLIRTINALKEDRTIQVIEGDQETTEDAKEIAETGCGVVQINTGTGCHLDAHMVAHALEDLQTPAGSLLFIENVGNLVCPALFDLGEFGKVCIVSVTEGDNKPLKYPHMIRASRVLILNKTDLLPHVDFDVERFLAHARQVNPDLLIFQLSARSGEGMEDWLNWVKHPKPIHLPHRHDA